MSGHTPGPWRAHFHVRNQRTKTGEWIFSSENRGILLRNGRLSIADARLIAAAPETLEALEALKAMVEPPGAPTEQAYLNAIAAIAKAEGCS